MKTKKIKLSLSKNTIANLNNSEILKVRGGATEQGITIPPCTDTCGTATCGCVTAACESRPAYVSCPIACPETADC